MSDAEYASLSHSLRRWHWRFLWLLIGVWSVETYAVLKALEVGHGR